MGLILNRAKANTATTGTGAVTLGAAVSPFQTWSAAGATSGFWFDYLIEDGASWEMGVGFYNGTTLTRPGPGTDPWFTSSTASLLVLTGAATVACVANKDTLGADGPFMPPLASSFSLQSGDATNLTLTNNASVGLVVDAGAPVAGNIIRYAYRTLTTKTLDWVMTARIDSLIPTTNFSGVGLTLYDSVANRAQNLFVQNVSPFFAVINWTGLAGGTPPTVATYIPAGVFPKWFRVQHVSPNYLFDISFDGVSWLNVYTIAATTFLTNRADRVGPGIYYSRTTGGRLFQSIPYFTLTGPGV